jgi:membrane protease YdiL (CAAX protease family)
VQPPIDAVTPVISRRLIALEVIIVLAISFGRSGVASILQLIDKLTKPAPLSSQTTTMNPSLTPDRPWLDLAWQVYYFILPAAEVALVIYLLHLAYGSARRLIGFDLTHPWRDLAYGFGVCAAIGIPGLAFFLLAKQLGLNTNVVAAGLNDVWWAVPILVCAAIVAGVSEETIMLGYLMTRLRTLNLAPGWIIVISAVIRGSYHLYQGWGGFLGNLVMGVVFAWLYLRWKRVMPLVVAHTLMDCFAFVGYAVIAPLVDWL